MAHPHIGPYLQVEEFSPASDAVLCSSHDPAYVDDVMSCRTENGFGNRSPEIAASLRYTVGSMVAAAMHVLTKSRGRFKVAASLTSGFHHAGYDFGGGYCTFNGLMAAAIRVHDLGLANRILILDMDQHHGNGTQDIIKQLGIDYITHLTARKSFNTASEALEVAQHVYWKGSQLYDLVLFQAGADIHIDDPLGGLLTTMEMEWRDRRVFTGCYMQGVPCVFNLAGGYQRDLQGTIAPVLQLHRNTANQCVRLMTGNKNQ